MKRKYYAVGYLYKSVENEIKSGNTVIEGDDRELALDSFKRRNPQLIHSWIIEDSEERP